MNFINIIFIITLGKLFIFDGKSISSFVFYYISSSSKYFLKNSETNYLLCCSFTFFIFVVLFCFWHWTHFFSFLGRPFQSLKTLSETFVFHSKCENVSEMKIFAFLFVVLTENELNCQINKSSFITNTHLMRAWRLFLTFFNCKNVKVAILHYSLTETVQNTNRS